MNKLFQILFQALTEPETFIGWVIYLVVGFSFTMLFWWGYAQVVNQISTPDQRAAARDMWDEAGAGNGM
jgi:hypothetical protein